MDRIAHDDTARAELAPRAPLAPLVADVYDHAAPPERLSLLNRLLESVGPLALAAVAAGAFARLLPTGRWQQGARASPDDALRVSAAQVLELARYVEQKSPEVLISLPRLVPDHALWAGTFSGVLLVMTARRLLGRSK